MSRAASAYVRRTLGTTARVPRRAAGTIGRVTNPLGVLAGLAASDEAAGIRSASIPAFYLAVLSLEFEAEVARLGPYTGHGLAACPIGRA